MTRKQIMENPDYTVIFFKILNGIDNHRELVKEWKKQIGDKEVSESAWSMRMRQLRKFGMIKSKHVSMGRGKGTRTKYTIDLQNILGYIYDSFLRKVTLNHELRKENSIKEPVACKVLLDYLLLFHKTNSQEQINNISLNELFHGFIQGIGRMMFVYDLDFMYRNESTLTKGEHPHFNIGIAQFVKIKHKPPKWRSTLFLNDCRRYFSRAMDKSPAFLTAMRYMMMSGTQVKEKIGVDSSKSPLLKSSL